MQDSLRERYYDLPKEDAVADKPDGSVPKVREIVIVYAFNARTPFIPSRNGRKDVTIDRTQENLISVLCQNEEKRF